MKLFYCNKTDHFRLTKSAHKFFLYFFFSKGRIIHVDKNKETVLIRNKSIFRLKAYIDRCLKNGVLKSIVHVIKDANFQLYRLHPDGVVIENLIIDDKFINKRLRLSIHQTMSLKRVEKEKILGRQIKVAKWLFNYP